MTPREAINDGQLEQGIRLQEVVVESNPEDTVALLFLVEMYALNGQLNAALNRLEEIDSSPEWDEACDNFTNIFRAQSSRRKAKPRLPEECPKHLRYRRKIWQKFRRDDTERLRDWVDRADRFSPVIAGHVDGREFEGLRDVDDRFGSVLEVFNGPHYSWIPMEQVRKIVLLPVAGLLDAAFRPAKITIGADEFNVILPMTYPESHRAGNDFALGLETDFHSEPNSILQGIGSRIWMLGDEEIRVCDCTQFDFRAV